MLLQYILPLLMAQADETGWLFLGLGLICLIPIIYFVIGIILCIWVYRDAEARGMNGVMWLLIVLLIGIIGLIIYLVVRKDKTVSKGGPPPPP